ncbi:CapA family protein [Luteococcus sp. H138]|uniref:CapA family protein n=1 Tax=unclassified Luteococcus TaxID=2639923 RepID=UPI00313B0E1F
MPRPRLLLPACWLAACLSLSACGGPGAAAPAPGGTSVPAPTRSSAPDPDSTGSPTPAPAPSSATPSSPGAPVPLPARRGDELLLAFAGDANAFSHAARSSELGLGEAGRLLAAADFSMVNLETALAEDASGLGKQPKMYTFLTGSAFPRMLQHEGVDLVSLANNHAMDYGVEGMRRTLAIKQASRLPMIGVGASTQEAFAPWSGEVRGRRVISLVGNDILESTMDWRPRDGKPGVAMVKTEDGFQTLVDGVTAQRKAHPDAVILVFMHWGIDYQVCTTRRQESMAKRLAEAGASIIVGTHAHRVQRSETIGTTLVAYGLGNFNFYSDRVNTRETGVLTVHVPTRGAPTAEWAPGKIIAGRPVLLTDAEADAARERWTTLPGGC